MTAVCPSCQHPFNARIRTRGVRYRCCSVACKHKAAGMLEGRRQQRAAANRLRFESLFGPLSVREIALVRRVYQQAYNIGYQRGRRSTTERRGVAA